MRVYAVDEAGRPLGVYVLDATATAGFRTEEEYVHLDGWRPVAVVRPDAEAGMSNPKIYPILTDHLGTPRKVLDGGTGEVRWSWDAKQPFGHEMPNETPTAGQAAFTFDLRFPGQRFDEETGLFHNGFRDYHSGLGRYAQSDPLGLVAGWNTYAYVSSSPLNASDNYGLSQEDIARIRLKTDELVQGMVKNQVRYPGSGFLNASINNILSVISRPQYQVCVDQATIVESRMSTDLSFQKKLDDKWTFTHTRSWNHHWIEGTSSNPKDPVIVIDPWLNKVEIKK